MQDLSSTEWNFLHTSGLVLDSNVFVITFCFKDRFVLFAFSEFLLFFVKHNHTSLTICCLFNVFTLSGTERFWSQEWNRAQITAPMDALETTENPVSVGTPQSGAGPGGGNSLTYFVVITIICFTGFFGNIMILVTKANKKFSKISTSVYLAVLAVSDIIIIFSGVFTVSVLASDIWLGFNLRSQSFAACIIIAFMLGSAPNISAWCIVAITVERLIVIIKPHRQVKGQNFAVQYILECHSSFADTSSVVFQGQTVHDKKNSLDGGFSHCFLLMPSKYSCFLCLPNDTSQKWNSTDMRLQRKPPIRWERYFASVGNDHLHDGPFNNNYHK